MIKGVNRQVIEVSSPDSLYFEKAVLYVRADAGALSGRELKNEAVSFVGSISGEYGRRRRRARRIALIAALSAAAAVIFFSVYFIL